MLCRLEAQRGLGGREGKVCEREGEHRRGLYVVTTIIKLASSLKCTNVPSALPWGEERMSQCYYIGRQRKNTWSQMVTWSFIDRKREESFTCLLVEDEQ
jgi:hypothetical protein